MVDAEMRELLEAVRSLEAEVAQLRGQVVGLRFDLSGKDWLTVDEAAHYCGVSRSQFDSNIAEYGIEPRNFMGKKLYEKAALYRAIHGARQWRREPLRGCATEPVSPGIAEAAAKLARYEKRRSRT